MSRTRLVWSDDPKDKEKVESDKKPTTNLDKKVVLEANFVAVFRIEKGGRGGKTVTVITGFPKHDTFLRELCKELKARCGSGGTYDAQGESGKIEIQGDKRQAIKVIFDKKGIRHKGM